MADCVIVTRVDALPSGDFLVTAAGMPSSEYPDESHALALHSASPCWSQCPSVQEALVAIVAAQLRARGDRVLRF